MRQCYIYMNKGFWSLIHPITPERCGRFGDRRGGAVPVPMTLGRDRDFCIFAILPCEDTEGYAPNLRGRLAAALGAAVKHWESKGWVVEFAPFNAAHVDDGRGQVGSRRKRPSVAAYRKEERGAGPEESPDAKSPYFFLLLLVSRKKIAFFCYIYMKRGFRYASFRVLN